MADSHQGGTSNEGLARAALRVFAGLTLMQHGFQKAFGMFGGERVTTFPSLDGFALPLETLGAALLILGLFTRPVAFVLAGEMAVAYFYFHAKRGLIPIVNRGEVSSLLCFVFLYFAAAGAGRYSLDWLRGRRLHG